MRQCQESSAEAQKSVHIIFDILFALWRGNYIILMKFSSLAALEVVI